MARLARQLGVPAAAADTTPSFDEARACASVLHQCLAAVLGVLVEAPGTVGSPLSAVGGASDESLSRVMEACMDAASAFLFVVPAEAIGASGGGGGGHGDGRQLIVAEMTSFATSASLSPRAPAALGVRFTASLARLAARCLVAGRRGEGGEGGEGLNVPTQTVASFGTLDCILALLRTHPDRHSRMAWASMSRAACDTIEAARSHALRAAAAASPTAGAKMSEQATRLYAAAISLWSGGGSGGGGAGDGGGDGGGGQLRTGETPGSVEGGHEVPLEVCLAVRRVFLTAHRTAPADAQGAWANALLDATHHPHAAGGGVVGGGGDEGEVGGGRAGGSAVGGSERQRQQEPQQRNHQQRHNDGNTRVVAAYAASGIVAAVRSAALHGGGLGELVGRLIIGPFSTAVRVLVGASSACVVRQSSGHSRRSSGHSRQSSRQSGQSGQREQHSGGRHTVLEHEGGGDEGGHAVDRSDLGRRAEERGGSKTEAHSTNHHISLPRSSAALHLDALLPTAGLIGVAGCLAVDGLFHGEPDDVNIPASAASSMSSAADRFMDTVRRDAADTLRLLLVGTFRCNLHGLLDVALPLGNLPLGLATRSAGHAERGAVALQAHMEGPVFKGVARLTRAVVSQLRECGGPTELIITLIELDRYTDTTFGRSRGGSSGGHAGGSASSSEPPSGGPSEGALVPCDPSAKDPHAQQLRTFVETIFCAVVMLLDVVTTVGGTRRAQASAPVPHVSRWDLTHAATCLNILSKVHFARCPLFVHGVLVEWLVILVAIDTG